MITIAVAARNVAVKQQYPRQKQKPKPKKKLRVVEAKRRQSISLPDIPFPVFIVSVSLVTAGIMVNVAQQAIVSQLSYEIEAVKKEILQAQQVQEKLLAQKSDLESPQRIEEVAINKLSMVKAPRVSYLKVINDGLSTGASSSKLSYSSKSGAAGKGESPGRVRASSGGRLGMSALAQQ